MRALALVLGVVLSLTGLVGIGLYAVGVIDIMVNRPADQSWLFWGLPLAIIGATTLLGGVGLLVLWRYLRNNEDAGSASQIATSEEGHGDRDEG